MKVFIRIILVLVILFLLGVVGATIFLTNDLKKNMKLDIKDVDLSKVEDGTYVGSYGKGRWANKVSVTVEKNKITDIDVTKTVMFEIPEKTTALTDKVIYEQRLNIDVVSGATATSKCYLKSIENALTK